MFYFLITIGALFGITAFAAVASLITNKSNGCVGVIVGFIAFAIVIYIFISIAEPFKSPDTPTEVREQQRRAWSNAFERRNRAMQKMQSAANANRTDEGLYWA